MPNLPMHIYLAHHTAAQLNWEYVDGSLGSYFLGCTAPDIRAMTKWSRERTHFAPLGVETVGAGTRRMFELHPELADHRRLSTATRAFLLGYISHLTTDEVWITTVFRPHFEDPNLITETEVEAHVWDRALQLDMDRKARVELDNLRGAAEAMPMAEQGVTVGFLPADVLFQWREWVCRFIGWDFSWERLKRALNRVYRDDDGVQRVVDRFLENMPESLQLVYEKIPEEKLVLYQEQALAASQAQVREYLGET